MYLVVAFPAFPKREDAAEEQSCPSEDCAETPAESAHPFGKAFACRPLPRDCDSRLAFVSLSPFSPVSLKSIHQRSPRDLIQSKRWQTRGRFAFSCRRRLPTSGVTSFALQSRIPAIHPSIRPSVRPSVHFAGRCKSSICSGRKRERKTDDKSGRRRGRSSYQGGT